MRKIRYDSILILSKQKQRETNTISKCVEQKIRKQTNTCIECSYKCKLPVFNILILHLALFVYFIRFFCMRLFIPYVALFYLVTSINIVVLCIYQNMILNNFALFPYLKPVFFALCSILYNFFVVLVYNISLVT